MNNYSLIQKFLHIIVLKYKGVRRTLFEFESYFSKNKHLNISKNKHIFVNGLARSGTTILLNSLYESDEFASLTYLDMPFVLSPNLWSNFHSGSNNFDSQHRAHKDGIFISTSSPEAFEEVFWKTYSDSNDESFEKYQRYLSYILSRYNKDRYLCKNNQNLKRINKIADILPNAKFFIPFREPLSHANSLLRQHLDFIQRAKDNNFIKQYMNLIGHTEFGPNYIPINKIHLYHDHSSLDHWLEQWNLYYMEAIKLASKRNKFYLINHDLICKNDEYWEKIQSLSRLSGNTKSLYKVKVNKISNKLYASDNLESCQETYKKLLNVCF